MEIQKSKKIDRLKTEPISLTVNSGKVTTTSLDIAANFGKQHKNVLRDIKQLDCSKEFRLLNFEPIFYKDSYGREQSAYKITRDGFTILIMGFTGRKAAAWKIKYLEAFNAMAQALLAQNQKPHEIIEYDAVKNQIANVIDLNDPENIDAQKFKKLQKLKHIRDGYLMSLGVSQLIGKARGKVKKTYYDTYYTKEFKPDPWARKLVKKCLNLESLEKPNAVIADSVGVRYGIENKMQKLIENA